MLTNKIVQRTTCLILTLALFLAPMTYVSAAETDVQEQAQIEKNEIKQLTDKPDKGSDYDGYIVRIDNNEIDSIDEKAAEDYDSLFNDKYYLVDKPEDALDFADPDMIDFIEPNYKRTAFSTTPFTTPNDTYYESYQKPYLDKINMTSAWALGYYGANTKVAVIDTGIIKNHEDLDNDNFYNGAGFVNNMNGNNRYTDDNGHGSFVTGIICAKTNNGKGIVSIAPDANFASYKFLDYNGDGWGWGVLYALNYMKRTNNIPDVVNMSFGGPGKSTSEQQIINEFADKGTIFIAASGNEGDEGSPMNYPAGYANVIGVGATDYSDVVTWFSTANSSVDISAPGQGISSLDYYSSTEYDLNSESSIYGSGTSYSSPMVAGAAAVLKSINPGMDHDEFMFYIIRCSKDLGKKGKDIYYGYGRLDVSKMIDLTQKSDHTLYNVKFVANGGKFTKTPYSKYKEPSNKAMPAIKRTGYTLKGWYTTPNFTGAKITNTNQLRGNVTVYAKWEANKYKIKFKGNGGKLKSKSKTVTYNKKIGTMKSAKRSGYNFLGWYNKKSGGSQYTKTKVYKNAKNTALYAHWTKKKVVRFNGTGGSVSKYAKSVKKGSKYGKLPTPKRSGYVFKGWYTKKHGGKKITASKRVKSSKNHTIYARWKAAPGK